MLADPINISGKSPAPAASARLPAGQEMPEKTEAPSEADKATAPSHTAELVADIQESLNMINNVDLQFSVHEASGEVMVIVTDGSTGEVIREIPPSEILDLAAKIDRMIGTLFDQNG